MTLTVFHLAGQHDQSDHGRKGPNLPSGSGSAPKTGQAALDAAPAKLRGDSLGPANPRHVRGDIEWEEGTDPGWTDAEANDRVVALEEYRGADFDPINKRLRGIEPQRILQKYPEDPAEFDSYLQRQTELMDSVLDASKLADDVTVTRGTSTGRGVFGDAVDGDLTGFEWTEDAYVSTTANPEIAEYFTISGLTMDINVPKGTGAVALSEIKRPNGDNDEAELLLQRGLRMRVVEDSGPGYPRKMKVEVVRG